MVLEKIERKKHQLDPAIRLLIAELNLDEGAILKRAGLPEDLLVRSEPRVTSKEFINFWDATIEEAGNPIDFPITIGTAASREIFSPAMFAFLCSPNLSIGINRLSQFKSLCGPMSLPIEETKKTLSIIPGITEKSIPIPDSLAATELVFILSIARRATKTTMLPRKIQLANHYAAHKAYKDFFGIEPIASQRFLISFDQKEASIPFLSQNQTMWETFEPQLRKRLSELNGYENISERVAASLLELLPSGTATMEAVANKLNMSKRTLQRRLNEDGLSFQSILNETRRELALHYLNEKNLTGVEISFLLGYQETSSFYRAFNSWTGTTPEAVRKK